jgi:hypothetical protein
MRLRNVLLVAASVILVGVVVAYVARERLVRWAMRPAGHFAAQTPPPAPNYDQPAAWAARPETTDPADLAPPGFRDEQASAAADVFFIHPTTYFRGRGWNAAYDEGGATRSILDIGVLRNQASAFNGCCRIFAPRYRQAALYSFFDDGEDGLQALELAYSDVRRAFDHFVQVESPSRPFILAAHSQGALHAIRLWQERIAGTPLERRLVVAYIVGYLVPSELQKDGMQVCESPTQTGCVVSWRTYEKGIANPRQAPRVWLHGAYVSTHAMQGVCISPLTWTAAAGAASLNLGSLAGTRKPVDALPALVPGVVGGGCEDGLLRVNEPADPAFRSNWMGKGNYHVLDYGLFYQNLRDNAVARVRAFLARQPARGYPQP